MFFLNRNKFELELKHNWAGQFEEACAYRLAGTTACTDRGLEYEQIGVRYLEGVELGF